MVATKDPGTLPDKATWYLATNLPRPDGPQAADSPHPAAGLDEIVRLYGIRRWIEQSYKQVKTEVGWADFQVRSATAIRRHQTLVSCAFSFCWNTWFAEPSEPDTTEPAPSADPGERGASTTRRTSTSELAQSVTRRPRMAHPMDHPAAPLARLDLEAATG